MVFDTKKPSPTPFFQQVIDDCIEHLQGKYGISLNISSDAIKKKFFSTIDETTKPLEIMYKNSLEEDLQMREGYLNSHFFQHNQTSVDHIRRKVMARYNASKDKLIKTFDALNPTYHIAKEKKGKILATIEILEKHKTADNLIEDMIGQLQENLRKAEEEMENTIVFEEGEIGTKNPDSLIKLQQQYLKRYQVPVQYRKIFGLVINRLNNFYQVKTNALKKADKHNAHIFDQLMHSDQTVKDIVHHLNNMITHKEISSLSDRKRKQKQEEKTQRIQSFCLGTKMLGINLKKPKKIEGQYSLEI